MVKTRSLPPPRTTHFRRAPPESEDYLIPLEEPLRTTADLEEPTGTSVLVQSAENLSPEPPHLYEEIHESQSENISSISVMVESV